ncbi:ATP-dependent DNA helicase DinG [Desulfacinum hydrothermale DSM 13146]|uniref:DNA 5'-3' helicase n=1 Tax=Desulfacinum hydrothermale DSM 13146 TaxID=1121390 RepID=A0A1W1XJJ7_9BACT|nr:ATP-dependent DNA helicase [Desulfacinum hydrothermale]SMC23701.1 ATP-dependent DNA helicase DinG [Desulfacinum hydrothermale DSM 13146]
MATAPSVESFFDRNGPLSRVVEAYEHRPAQSRMAQAVWEAIGRSVPLLAEAGTGTGKTFAYLVPALLSGKKTVVSTATKALQDQILGHDIPFLQRHFFPKLRMKVLKGRRNYLCLRRYHEFSYQPSFFNREEAASFQKLRSWATQTRSGDRAEVDLFPEDAPLWGELTASGDQCLGSQCPHHEECFVQKNRAEAARADLLVVNHHLFFASLSVEGEGAWDLLSSFEVFVFDEAHRLEDVAALYFGLEFSSYQVLETLRDLQRAAALPKAPAELRTRVAGTGDHLSRKLWDLHQVLVEGAGKRGGRVRLDPSRLGKPFQTIGADLVESLRDLAAFLESHGSLAPAVDLARGRLSALAQNLEMLSAQEDPHLTYWYEASPVRKSFTLHATPLEVAPILSERVFSRTGAVILTSATLATAQQGRPSFHFIRDRLGVPAEAMEKIFASPFDFSRQALLYLPQPFPAPQDRRFCQAVAAEARAVLERTQGRALFLFTSYRNMHEVHQRLVADGALPYPILCQGERPKRALLADFKKQLHSVLLATYSFWEGIDVPGEALSCVLIDKLPFEVPDDPITAARLEILKRSGENAFYRYQVPRAVLLLKQGIGRLIRSRTDRGLVVLFDCRLTTKPYGRVFLQSLPSIPVIRRLSDFPPDFL